MELVVQTRTHGRMHRSTVLVETSGRPGVDQRAQVRCCWASPFVAQCPSATPSNPSRLTAHEPAEVFLGGVTPHRGTALDTQAN